MDTTARRKRHRASFGYSIKMQGLVTPDTADNVRKLADILETSEGSIVRDALEVYGLHKRIVTAQETIRKRRQRAERGSKEGGNF